MNKTLTIATIAIVAIVAIVIFSIWFFILDKKQPVVVEETKESQEPITVQADESFIKKYNEGSYEEALMYFEKTFGVDGTSHTKDPDEIARAKTTKQILEYKVNLTLENIVSSIQVQKDIAADTTVSDRLRSRALTQVGIAFCIFGRNPALIPYIYSGEYAKYIEGGDPSSASFKILKEANELYPNPRATIGMANWYVKELMGDKLSVEEKSEYIKEAERLLAEADKLAQAEIDRTANSIEEDQFKNTHRYPSYLFWRAFVVGGLAMVVGGDYVNEYKQEYEDFFAVVNSMGNHNNSQYLPPAYMLYAYFLLNIDDNKEAALAAIEKSVDYVQNDPRPEVNEFTMFMGYERQKLEPTDIFWYIMNDMAELSPRFREFVDAAVEFVNR